MCRIRHTAEQSPVSQESWVQPGGTLQDALPPVGGAGAPASQAAFLWVDSRASEKWDLLSKTKGTAPATRDPGQVQHLASTQRGGRVHGHPGVDAVSHT